MHDLRTFLNLTSCTLSHKAIHASEYELHWTHADAVSNQSTHCMCMDAQHCMVTCKR